MFNKQKTVAAFKLINKHPARHPVWRMWLKNSLRLPLCFVGKKLKNPILNNIIWVIYKLHMAPTENPFK